MALTSTRENAAVRGVLARHGWRFASFSGIGAFVLIVGVAVQALLIRFGAGAYGSYAGQIAISIELSFVLNWRFTWKSRNAGFWRAGWRFNVQKLLLTVPNLALYAFLVRESLGWLPANLATTAVFTLANYVSGDLWSFTRPRVRRPASTGTAAVVQPMPAVLPDGAVPTASVIIPCKASEATIRATLKSLLDQDYPGLAQVILVGDVGDSTWTAIRDVDDPRLVVLEQEAIPGRRDPNAKRDGGISKATGDILALVDSDIVMDPGWLSTAAAMLLAQGGGLVAGGMRSIHDTFWGRFVDRNVLAAKTPRLPHPYPVTAQNFGRRGYKPPVTANAVFTRTLYESCALDTAWAYGYEDYEWFWRVVQAGHPILFSGALTAAHHHRRSFGRLIMEYKQSARGCAHFIRRHPDSPLARKRKRQGLLLPPAAVMATAAAITASLAGYSETIGALFLAALACLAGREAARARSLEALAYPPATLALGWIYATTIAGGLARDRPRTDAAPLWNNTPPSVWRRIGARISWPLSVILALQAAFSLSLVWSNTAFGDEADYLWQGRLEWAHWLHGYPIPVFTYDSGAPQFYPALGALADSVGGLAGARILSLCFMLAANVLLYLTARRLFGFRAAVVASALWGVSEPVLRLAFATYDPLACFLVTLAAWLAVQAGTRKRHAELIVAASVSLAAASVVAFSFGIMIPAVVTMAYLVWCSQLGWRLALWCAGWLAACTCFLACAALTCLHLWTDVIDTTITRQVTGGRGDGVAAVASAAWSWDGLIFAIACGGAALAFAFELTLDRKLLVLALVGIGLLVPVYQGYQGIGWSMDKHMSACTWFLALAAGYAAQRVPLPAIKPIGVAVTGIALLVYPAITGLWYARSTFHSWPSTASLVAAVRPVLADTNAPFLTDDGSVLSYYLPAGRVLGRIAAPTLTSPADIAEGRISGAAFDMQASPGSAELVQEALSAPYTDSVAANFLKRATGSPEIYAAVRALERSSLYRIKAVLPYTTIVSDGLVIVWQRAS